MNRKINQRKKRRQRRRQKENKTKGKEANKKIKMDEIKEQSTVIKRHKCDKKQK